jgi:hypothetical protein
MSFGSQGRVTTAIDAEAGSFAYGMRVVFPLNFLAPPMVVVGSLVTHSSPATSTVFAVGYNANGSRFNNFGTNGISITQAPGVGYHQISDAYSTTDGKVTIFGHVEP